MWKMAMDEKMEAIRKNKTWSMTDRPASRRVLKSKWVYKVKNEIDKNGNNTTRHKARLCFMGNRQIKRLDFNETFAPVAKFTTFRCILAITAANGWELHHMDVKTRGCQDMHFEAKWDTDTRRCGVSDYG